jgi:choline dehydrogenase-like flavoprotein
MHPASRGWVHIQSADPTVHPHVNTSYFDSPSDLEMAKMGVRHVLKLAETDAWKNVVSDCLLETNKDSRDPIGDHCRQWLSTTFHWVGTASMMPREKGGVVDPRLKVYGTSNLRVVSLHIIGY